MHNMSRNLSHKSLAQFPSIDLPEFTWFHIPLGYPTERQPQQ